MSYIPIKSCNLSPPKCLIKSPQKKLKLQYFQSIPPQLAIEIWANLFQNNAFQLLQSSPNWPYFGTFAVHNQSFSKGQVFSPSKPKKVPQKPTKRVWNLGQMFSIGFFSMVSGVTNGPPGCWIRRRYSKVTAVLSRRLETGSQHDVSHKAQGWCWNHEFVFWWRLGWFGWKKVGVEMVKA